MIAYLKGRLVHKEPAFVIIDVHGIGYQVMISLSTYSEIKDREDITLQTVLVVREDAHILYGFASSAEKIMFQQLVSVNGIGPGTAMMVLSSMGAADLRSAIIKEEVHTLQSVKGIGAKTAQRLILELKDKVRKEGGEGLTGPNSQAAHNNIRAEALTALMTLGFSRQAAEKSIDAVLKKSGNSLSLEDLVKIALKSA
jgi:Holliday junction DNA helicase RuvA